MKTLIMTLITLTTLSAQASFIQTTCSSSNGKLIKNNGHIDNQFYVVKNERTENSYKEVKIELNHTDHMVDIANEVLIDSKETRGCAPGQRGGFWSKEAVMAKKIVITKRDGSEFEVTGKPGSYIYGLSQDKLSIEAFIICESHISSRIMCED